MSVKSSWEFFGPNQQFVGYLATPNESASQLPVIIVLQEIWGVDEHIKDVANRFASAGYAAFAPDLYVREKTRKPVFEPNRIDAVKQFLGTLPPTAWHSEQERDAHLAKLPEPQQTQIRETFVQLFAGLNMENYIEHLLETAKFLREDLELTRGQKMASIGFCMGGALSAITASVVNDLSGAVIFYGNSPKTDRIQTISCPVLGFYGGLDERITSQVPEFDQSMKEAGKSFSYHIYDGAHHAFFNDTRPSYNVQASRDAFAKVLAFFNEQLG